jgi:predicted AAA+ superfamily ATPase
MSWFELGFSSGKTSVAKLLRNNAIATDMSEISIDDIVERIIIGGWPGNLGKKIEAAQRVNKSYIDLISEIDLAKVSKISRDPNKVCALLKSLARNISTTANIQTLVDDARQDSDIISRITVNEYLDALERLMLIENQTVWNTHIRSSGSLRKTPKRHFADPSMAVSILGLDKEEILNNTQYLGFLFESLVIHNLRVYAQECNGQVFHYRDSNDKEIDAIVQNRAGQWAAFEVKLGSKSFDEAAKILLRLQVT